MDSENRLTVIAARAQDFSAPKARSRGDAGPCGAMLGGENPSDRTSVGHETAPTLLRAGVSSRARLDPDRLSTRDKIAAKRAPRCGYPRVRDGKPCQGESGADGYCGMHRTIARERGAAVQLRRGI